MDVIFHGPTGLAWYENSDGMGTFGRPQPFANSPGSVRSVFAADLDGDGDQDVLAAILVFAGDRNSIFAWYENTDGKGGFGPQQMITTTFNVPVSVFAADLDGDGDQDVLSASTRDDEIAWYENTDGMGAFGPQQVISTFTDGARSIFVADLDGDGDQDVLSASESDDKIAWYENTDGMGVFGPQRVISTSAVRAQSVFAADLDGDGDQDVLSASREGNKIAWYENTDGMGAFGPQQVITTSAQFAISVFATDVDGDGDRDVLSASVFDDKIAWYENVDGNGAFGAQRVITISADEARWVFAADIDGDGDQDVLSASSRDYKITWYENTDGMGAFGPQLAIAHSVDGAQSVFAADIDGDGDQDVLSASSIGGSASRSPDDKIAWYENVDGNGAFGPQRVITTSTDGARSVFAADLDGDGDQDVLSASFDDNKIAWYENTDGMGEFGPQRVVTTLAFGARSVFAADFDGDGDQDILSASHFGDVIAWYENTNAMGVFGPQQVISTSAVGLRSVFAADLDGDGDQDVLSASLDGKTAWYENTDGMGAFGPQRVIMTSASVPSSVLAADLDGDGDQDVLSAAYLDDEIAWYENTDGLGAFGPPRLITTLAGGFRPVLALDLDADGDQDILMASTPNGRIVWSENTDGKGAFGPLRAVSTMSVAAGSIFAADLDGDGNLDVLSASTPSGLGKIAWYENLGPPSSADSGWVKYR